MSRVKILSLLLVVIGSSHADTDCTGLTGEHFTNCNLCPENYTVVLSKSGPIGGSSAYAVPAGRDFWYFKGIPYAEPPVGKLRLRNPVKVKPWTTTKWCLEHGNMCIQNIEPPSYVGAEDCLTLNIYVPKDKCSPTDKCPVIFVVHQSNFFIGSGNSDQLGPDQLVGEDVVIVTINYRLEGFGFVCTGDQNIQGNSGLMDQIMALLWVRENIAAFGGERALVTLFGDGASTGYLCAAEYTKGLFSHVVVQSSSSFSGWAYQPNPQKMIRELAEGMNLTYTGMPDLAEKLRNACAQDILTAAANLRNKYLGAIAFINAQPLAPTIDDFMPALVPLAPRRFMEIILESGERKICHGAKIMSGINSFEKGTAKIDILTTPTLLADIENDHEMLVPPVCVGVTKGSPQSIAIGDKLFNFYFSNGVTPLQYYRFASMLTIVNGNIAFVRYNVKSGEVVYTYIFRFCSQTNYMRRTFVPEYSCGQQSGPCFLDDYALVYYQSELSPYQKLYPNNVTIINHNDRTYADRHMSAQMVRYFSNFAKTNNPNGCGPPDPLFGSTVWEPVTDMSDINTMYFDSTLKMDHHSYQADIDFWETLCDY